MCLLRPKQFRQTNPAETLKKETSEKQKTQQKSQRINDDFDNAHKFFILKPGI